MLFSASSSLKISRRISFRVSWKGCWGVGVSSQIFYKQLIPKTTSRKRRSSLIYLCDSTPVLFPLILAYSDHKQCSYLLFFSYLDCDSHRIIRRFSRRKSIYIISDSDRNWKCVEEIQLLIHPPADAPYAPHPPKTNIIPFFPLSLRLL